MWSLAAHHSMFCVRHVVSDRALVHVMCYTSSNGAAKILFSIDTEKRCPATVYERARWGYENSSLSSSWTSVLLRYPRRPFPSVVAALGREGVPLIPIYPMRNGRSIGVHSSLLEIANPLLAIVHGDMAPPLRDLLPTSSLWTLEDNDIASLRGIACGLYFLKLN